MVFMRILYQKFFALARILWAVSTKGKREVPDTVRASATFLEVLEWSLWLLNFTIHKNHQGGCLKSRLLCPFLRGLLKEVWAGPGILHFQTSVPR